MKCFKKEYFFVALFIIICVAMMAGGAYTEYQFRDKMNRFTECSGEIASYLTKETTDSDGNKETLYAPVYEYMVGTQIYNITGSYVDGKPKIGKDITIYYNPDNPVDAICQEEKGGTSILLFYVGLGFLLVFIGMLGIQTRFKLIPLGIGMLVLGTGMIFSIPGFAVRKIVVLVFPLLGVWMICSSVMEMTGLDKKYLGWKKSKYPHGYPKTWGSQNTGNVLTEENRGEKIVNVAGGIISIASLIPMIIIGVIFFGAGLFIFITAVAFDKFVGIVFMGVGSYAVYLSIRNIIFNVKKIKK